LKYGIQAVLPVMRRQRAGRIVSVSSGTTRGFPVGAGGYAASKAAMNMLTEVARRDFADDGIDVSLVLPSVTASEFAGGRLLPGAPTPPGMTVHTAEYVGRVILRALRTGEQRIDIPHGPELPELTEPEVSPAG
jgi:NAD(P)-dependent dehydrogenase (short-subunit alcohol dehydrogenase family)